MTEQDMTGAQVEALASEISQAAAEETQPNQQEQAAPKESPADRNWSEARRVMEELKRQNEELRREMLKMQEPKQRVEEPVDPELEIEDDDYLTGAKAKKLVEKATKRAIEQVMKQQQEVSLPERIRQEMPDFDQVCSQENLEELIKNDRKVAKALEAVPDKYTQAILAYDAIKSRKGRLSVQAEIDKQKAIQNSKKPVSSQTVHGSAIGQANAFSMRLTSEMKQQLWKEMNDAARGSL